MPGPSSCHVVGDSRVYPLSYSRRNGRFFLFRFFSYADISRDALLIRRDRSDRGKARTHADFPVTITSRNSRSLFVSALSFRITVIALTAGLRYQIAYKGAGKGEEGKREQLGKCFPAYVYLHGKHDNILL